MSQRELVEHRGYLEDERRNAAYRSALGEVVRPGDVVLDLGAGTGILGYFACQAGAKSVIALDRGDILETAERIAADNGYGSRITHVKRMSTEATLETPVDVVVCDQIGGAVHDAGILSYFADARQRLLAADGRLVPASFRLFVAPVQYDEVRDELEFWSSTPYSYDLSAVRPLAVNTEWTKEVEAEDLLRLSTPKKLASFSSDHDIPISGSAEFTIEAEGRFDGFLGWFEAQLSPSVTLTNDPWSPDRFKRWCNFYPVDQAVDAERGDHLRLGLDIRPKRRIVSWTAEALTSKGEQQTRHSTFLKTSKSELFGLTGPVPVSGGIRQARLVMDLIDGTRTAEDIVEALTGEVGTFFVSRLALEHFVRRVTAVIR